MNSCQRSSSYKKGFKKILLNLLSNRMGYKSLERAWLRGSHNARWGIIASQKSYNVALLTHVDAQDLSVCVAFRVELWKKSKDIGSLLARSLSNTISLKEKGAVIVRICPSACRDSFKFVHSLYELAAGLWAKQEGIFSEGAKHFRFFLSVPIISGLVCFELLAHPLCCKHLLCPPNCKKPACELRITQPGTSPVWNRRE